MNIAALIIFIVLFLSLGLVFTFDMLKRKKSETKYHTGEVIVGYLLLLPAVVLAFYFIILPIFFSFGYAFTDYDLLKPTQVNFVGIDFCSFSGIITGCSSEEPLAHKVIFVLL